jgi:hypothetical protein
MRNLFDKKSTLSKVKMGKCHGGAKSSCGYADTRLVKSGEYDYEYNTVNDVVISGQNADTPSKACTSVSLFAVMF